MDYTVEVADPNAQILQAEQSKNSERLWRLIMPTLDTKSPTKLKSSKLGNMREQKRIHNRKHDKRRRKDRLKLRHRWETQVQTIRIDRKQDTG